MKRADKYRSSLQESYISECIGAELYLLLGQGPHGSSENHRKVLSILESIEKQTRDTLSELITEAGSVPDQGRATDIAENIANLAASKSWESLHAWLLEGSQQGSDVYMKLRDFSENPNDERILSILHHVTVVESIYRAEANGESDLALAVKYLDEKYKPHISVDAE